MLGRLGRPGTADTGRSWASFVRGRQQSGHGRTTGVAGRLTRDGTLQVNASSSTWAFELDRLAPVILDQLRPELGEATPPALRFVPGPIPEPEAAPGERRLRRAPKSAPSIARRRRGSPLESRTRSSANTSLERPRRASLGPLGRGPAEPAPTALSDTLLGARKMLICRAFLMAETAYTAKDITVLEGLEPVRLRPGMYIGSTGARGLHHLVYEVVDNSVDEALAGRNDRIEVTLNPDNSVTVRDWGSGIPVDIMAEPASRH